MSQEDHLLMQASLIAFLRSLTEKKFKEISIKEHLVSCKSASDGVLLECIVTSWDVTHSLETKSDFTSRLPKSHIRKNGGNRILLEQVI